MKRFSLIVAAFVFTSVLFVGVILLPEARATTRYVGGAGPGNYTTIQLAIDDASPGDKIFVYGGTYEEQVTVHSSLSLVGDDANTTVISGNWTGTPMNITADWVNVSGFTFTKSGWNLEGLRLSSVEHCSIAGNSFRNNYVGIHLWFSHNNTIANNNATDNWDIGFYLNNSDFNTLRDNLASENDYGMIHIFSYGNLLERNQLWANTEYAFRAERTLDTIVRENRIQAHSLAYGTRFDYSENIRVENNNFSNGNGGVYFWHCTNVTFTGNYVSNQDFGVGVSRSSTATIFNNTIHSHTWEGVRIHMTPNVTVSQNNIWDVEKAIDVRESANLTIEGNSANGSWAHIYVQDSVNATVIHNEASHGRRGIELGRSENITIAHNEVLFDDYWAVTSIGSENVTIQNNNISHNQMFAIFLGSSANVSVVDNNISANQYGIYLSNSTGTLIHHNIIADNAVQAFDNRGSENSWNDDYPSGGNYWSDYSGPDDYRGPGQNIPGSDDVGDNPYIIDSDSKDHYPLLTVGAAIPHPPENVTAFLSGGDLENVTVMWEPSPDESNGQVVRYDILRSDNYSESGNLYSNIGGVSNGTYSFVDAFVGEGNPNAYFYMICAVNLTNYSTCADNQAGKFIHSLSAGPNPVSVPLIQLDESVETVLQTVEYDKAWFYDSPSQEWNWYTKDKTYSGGLSSLNQMMGLWVNVTQNSNLTVAGIVPAQTTIHLYEGWNLVSFPSLNASYTVADLKAETGATEGYDLAPPYFLRVLGDADVLQAGYAYWMRVDADIDWMVEAS